MGVQRWWFQWPLRLRALLRGGQVEQELDEELRFHLDHLVEDGLAAGMSRKAARDAALKTMGGVTQQKEEMRDMQGLRWLTDLREDVRYAIRSLRRAPGLTGFVVLALALGIGLSAASFSMLDALVFRPYPDRKSTRLNSSHGGISRMPSSA